MPIARAAQWTDLNRSTPYRPPRGRTGQALRRDEPRVLAQLRRVAYAHPTYGHRRVWAMLRREGVSVNRKRVLRRMALEGLLRPAHFPRPRLPSTGRLIAERPNERWYTDMTEVDTTDFRSCALMTVLDACTRETVAWEFFSCCGAAETRGVVEVAVAKRLLSVLRAAGTVLVVDQGGQFIAKPFREGTQLLGLDPRWTRKRRPEDNGLQESFHGHLKQDYLSVREPDSFFETRRHLAKAIRHYNTERRHSSLGYLTRREFAERAMEEA